MHIGVLSDTHLPKRGRDLPAKLLIYLEKMDLVIHAGDFTGLSILRRLENLAPVRAVYGNVDSEEITAILNEKEEFCLEGLHFGLIHGSGGRGTTRSRALEAFPGADCIIFGHSHIPGMEHINNKLLINPGSPTDKRTNPFYTYGVFSLESGALNAELLILPDNERLAQLSLRFDKTAFK